MTTAAADQGTTRPMRSWGHEISFSRAYVTIGAAGAVNTSGAGYYLPPDVAITAVGSGVYTLTFPPGAYADIVPRAGLSADATVFGYANLTAFSPSAGTATIKCVKGSDGTYGDPASGDAIGIHFFVVPRAYA